MIIEGTGIYIMGREVPGRGLNGKRKAPPQGVAIIEYGRVSFQTHGRYSKEDGRAIRVQEHVESR